MGENILKISIASVKILQRLNQDLLDKPYEP